MEKRKPNNILNQSNQAEIKAQNAQSLFQASASDMQLMIDWAIDRISWLNENSSVDEIEGAKEGLMELMQDSGLEAAEMQEIVDNAIAEATMSEPKQEIPIIIQSAQSKIDKWQKWANNLLNGEIDNTTSKEDINEAKEYLLGEMKDSGLTDQEQTQIVERAIGEAVKPKEKPEEKQKIPEAETSDIAKVINYLNNAVKEYETEKVIMQKKIEAQQKTIELQQKEIQQQQEEIEKLKEQVNILGNEVKTDKERDNTPKTINRKISDFFLTNYIISNMKSLLSKLSKLQLLIELRKFKTKITLILLCGLIIFHIKFVSSKTYIAELSDAELYISTTSEFQYVNYLNSIQNIEVKNEFIESTKVVYFFNLTENTLYYIYFSYFILISILILSTKFSFSISNNES